jgi:hypothetical protein
LLLLCWQEHLGTSAAAHHEANCASQSPGSNISFAVLYLFHLCSLSSIDFSIPAGGEVDSICYLQAQQSAKSFSFATQRKQQFEQAEKQQAAQAAHKEQCPSVKYDNINQFSQKVELYRGR